MSEDRYWITLLETQCIGYSLVRALTWLLGILDKAASSLFEPLTIPSGPLPAVTPFSDPLDGIAGFSP